jgi:hypothetical protein
MLQLIGLGENLVERTCQEILAGGGNDFSQLAVVFPSKRFGFFLRQELSSQVKGNFFPPAMYAVEIFFKSLFQLNFPGFKVLNDLEAAHAVYESANAVFPAGIYGGGRINDFPAFLPWARKLLAALEEYRLGNIRRIRRARRLSQVLQGIYPKYSSLAERFLPALKRQASGHHGDGIS